MKKDSLAATVGVVLAGGASRRMGRDKARLRLASGSLVEGAASRLGEVVQEVAIADRGRQLVSGMRSLADGPGGGPAAGILGAANAYAGRALLVLACDLPAVPAALLRNLALGTSDQGIQSSGAREDAHVPRWDRGVEPLCAVYRPSAIAILASEVESGRYALHKLLANRGLHVRYLEGRALTAFGSPERLFLNLNTPEDLARLEMT